MDGRRCQCLTYSNGWDSGKCIVIDESEHLIGMVESIDEYSSQVILLLLFGIVDHCDGLNNGSVDGCATFGRETLLNQLEEVLQQSQEIRSIFSCQFHLLNGENRGEEGVHQVTRLLVVEDHGGRMKNAFVKELTQIEGKRFEWNQIEIENQFHQCPPSIDVRVSPIHVDSFVVQLIGIGENTFAIVDIVLLLIVAVHVVDQLIAVARGLLNRSDFVGEKLSQRFQTVQFQIVSFVVLTRLEDVVDLGQVDVRRLQLMDEWLIFFAQRNVQQGQGQAIQFHVDQFEEKIDRRVDEILRDDRRFVGQMEEFESDETQ